MIRFLKVVVALTMLVASQPSQAGILTKLLFGGGGTVAADVLATQYAIRAAVSVAFVTLSTRSHPEALANLTALILKHPLVGRGLALTALANIVHNDPTTKGDVAKVGAEEGISAAEIERKTASVNRLSGTTGTDDPRCDDRNDEPAKDLDARTRSHSGQALPPRSFADKTVPVTVDGQTFLVRFDANGWPDFTPYMIADVKVADTAGFFRGDHASQLAAATRAWRDQLKAKGVTPFQLGSKEAFALEKGKGQIPGYTWHHHQDPGRMQLVQQKLHAKTTHYGGWYANKCLQTNDMGKK